MKFKDTILFLKEVLRTPRQIGALFPSSTSLADAMAGCLPMNPGAYVVELGPGTGTVTQALLNSGLAPNRLVAIEKSEKLSQHLRARFPGICVLTGDAFALDNITRDQLPEAGPLDAVISSLPLRNFSADTVNNFCRTISSVLRPGGVMVQYSYYIHHARIHGLEAMQRERSSIVWRNLPPARVYLYRNQPCEQPLISGPIGEPVLDLANGRRWPGSPPFQDRG